MHICLRKWQNDFYRHILTNTLLVLAKKPVQVDESAMRIKVFPKLSHSVISFNAIFFWSHNITLLEDPLFCKAFHRYHKYYIIAKLSATKLSALNELSI